jgi:hypothetical protein
MRVTWLFLVSLKQDRPSATQALASMSAADRETNVQTHQDAKSLAAELRHALRERNAELSHSDTLEIVARNSTPSVFE